MCHQNIKSKIASTKNGCRKVDRRTISPPLSYRTHFLSNLASRYGKLVYELNELVNLRTNLPYTVTLN
jgi:hypothetical protein